MTVDEIKYADGKKTLRIVYNKILPFPGYKCVNLFGMMLVRKGCTMSDTDLNHELIHTEQMKELGYVFFYIVYFFEWLGRLLLGYSDAYRGISFEREAYNNQGDSIYLVTRRHFAQWRK